MRRDIRGLLNRLSERAGWKAGEIRAKMLGHGSTAMVAKVYSHLGTLRHRSEVVEYRVEQHAVALAKRLDGLHALDNVTQNVTRLPPDAAA